MFPVVIGVERKIILFTPLPDSKAAGFLICKSDGPFLKMDLMKFLSCISVRTLYRYEKAFAEKQFSGLKPADREKHRSQNLPKNFEFLLEQAIQLRKEVPERSVAKIIYILEAEGLVAPGILKRSTLERHIYRVIED